MLVRARYTQKRLLVLSSRSSRSGGSGRCNLDLGLRQQTQANRVDAVACVGVGELLAMEHVAQVAKYAKQTSTESID